MFKTYQKFTALFLVMLSALLLSACGASTPTVDPQAVITEAAATVAAQLTQSAALTPSATVTNTPEPTATMAEPTATVAQPTLPAAPAATNTPAPVSQAPASTTGDAASFVADVSIPDNTVIASGANFEKTWRVKNTGQTTWNTSYSLVYIDGERMGAPDNISIPKEVKPGETVDITVKLTAPSKNGTFKTFFRPRSASGQLFKLDGGGDLWVQIVVGSGGSTPTPGTATTAQPTATNTQAAYPAQ